MGSNAVHANRSHAGDGEVGEESKDGMRAISEMALDVIAATFESSVLSFRVVPIGEGPGRAVILQSSPNYAAIEIEDDGMVLAFSDRKQTHIAEDVEDNDDSIFAAVERLQLLSLGAKEKIE